MHTCVIHKITVYITELINLKAETDERRQVALFSVGCLIQHLSRKKQKPK